jgi:hypothetical protein
MYKSPTRILAVLLTLCLMADSVAAAFQPVSTIQPVQLTQTSLFAEQALVARARLSGRLVIEGLTPKGLHSFWDFWRSWEVAWDQQTADGPNLRGFPRIRRKELIKQVQFMKDSRDSRGSEGKTADSERLITKFQSGLPDEYKRFPPTPKLEKLLSAVGAEAFTYFGRAAHAKSFSWQSPEESVLRVANHLLGKYMMSEVNGIGENDSLRDLEDFIAQLYPHRHSATSVLDAIYRRDAAHEGQRKLREGLSRVLSIPTNRIVFVDPADEWLNSFFGLTSHSLFGRSRDYHGVTRQLYDTEDAQPEKIIVIATGQSDFDSLVIAAHEGSHWEQSSSMLQEMEEKDVTRSLGEGFQRYREYAVLARMVNDPITGTYIKKLVEEAFRNTNRSAKAIPFEEMLWMAVNRPDTAYVTEAALVRGVVRRIGLEPMTMYFLSGDREALHQAFNDKSLDLLNYFFENWSFGIDGRFDPRQRAIPMALALHFISREPVTDEHLRRVGVILNELKSFFDNVLVEEHIAHSMFDCFDASKLLPLLDNYLSGRITDTAFRRLLIHDLRATAANPLERVQLIDWFPNMADIGPVPDISKILPPKAAQRNSSSDQEPPSGGAKILLDRVLNPIIKAIRNIRLPGKNPRSNIWTLRSA